MIFGQPQLGAWTDPFKKVGKVVYKAHVVGTKALVKVAKDPRVQQAAAQSAQQYAQKNYSQQYQAVTPYAQQAKAILRPPGPQAPVPMPQMMPPGGEEDAGDMMPTSAGPVQKGNFTTLALIGGAAIILLVMMKK